METKPTVDEIISQLRETTKYVRWQMHMDKVMSSMFREACEARGVADVEKPVDPGHILQIGLHSLRKRRDMLDESLALYAEHREDLRGNVPEDILSEEEMKSIRAPIEFLEEKQR